MKDLMTTKELAEFLRLNEKKIYQLVRDGAVPHVRVGGKWLFPRGHVMRWVDENVQYEQDVHIVGSDDVLLTRFLSTYSKRDPSRTLAFYSPVGSMGGLRALVQKKGQACCVHLLDPETGEYNLPVLARFLSTMPYVVVNLWYRMQGMIVKKGNPLGVKTIADVARTGIRFVNRNEGAGTRVLVEHLLRREHVETVDIEGFSHAVDSHLESALSVFFDEADVAVGIQYVTHLVPLDFIPLQEERFDLVIPAELWQTRLIQDFMRTVDATVLSSLAGSLPGYNFRDTGQVLFQS